MVQQFKWGPRSARDPQKGIYCGLEFDVMFAMGKIAPGETVQIEMLPGIYPGAEGLFTSNGWNAEITAPNGGVVIDFGGKAVPFPQNENDPYWVGMGYPPMFNGKWILRYSGTFGAKAGWMLGAGLTKAIGSGTGIRITGYSTGTVSGNATGILANWPGCKLWLEGVTVDHCDDGVRGHFVWYVEKDCTCYQNGAGDGQSHAKYIDAEVAVVDGGNSYDTKVGHDGKWETWLLVLRNHNNKNTMTGVTPGKGPSYDHDINGGLVFHIGGELDDNGYDANQFHMVQLNTVRRPMGPHGYYAFGVKYVAQVIKSGDFFGVDNRALDYSDPANYDYHKAPQLANADGSLVSMPVDVLISGCDGQYAPGKISYKAKNWNVLKAGVSVLNNIDLDNDLIAADDPLATAKVTHVDLAALAGVNEIGAVLATEPVFTPELVDDLHAKMVAIRSKWTYPVAALAVPQPPVPDPVPVPTPTPPPPTDQETILALEKQIADLNAARDALTQQAQADVAAAQAAQKTAEDALTAANATNAAMADVIAKTTATLARLSADIDQIVQDRAA